MEPIPYGTESWAADKRRRGLINEARRRRARHGSPGGELNSPAILQFHVLFLNILGVQPTPFLSLILSARSQEFWRRRLVTDVCM